MVIKRTNSGYWSYRFMIDGTRYKKGRFRTKKEASIAEQQKRMEILSRHRRYTLSDAWHLFIKNRHLESRTRDEYGRYWEKEICSAIGHLWIEEITSLRLEEFRNNLSSTLGPESRNKRVKLIGTILKYMVKCNELAIIPHIPTEKVNRKQKKWYTEEERDRLLDGFYEWYPHWYLFWYLTCRLGLRKGEVYALTHEQVDLGRKQIVIDRAVVRGYKDRPATVKNGRKTGDYYILNVADDILEAYEWHCRMGYAGRERVFYDSLPKYLDGHRKALENVQRRKRLPMLPHHQIGRHSVGSQAQDRGLPLADIQRQLGHKCAASTEQYAHGGKQENVVIALQPSRPPHGRK